MYTNFISHIRRYIEIDDLAAAQLMKYVTPLKLKRKEYLLEAGQICHSLYFVEKGCVKMFFVDEKLKEQITQFAMENWWIADHFSFLDNKPSTYFIQTIEKSEILQISNLSFEAMLQELPQLERYFRIIMQKAVAANQLRSKLVYEMSKEEFYQHFATSFPEFVQRVPQYMIASYLGLTPQYVSELRKKK